MPTIAVLRAGLLTSVQDGGRFGLQHLGVPPAGPMDPLAFRIANLVAGNDAAEAALEVTIAGPELRFDDEAVVAISGADLEAAIDGRDAPLDRALTIRAGGILSFGARRVGARAYVAVRGGLDLPAVLGSRAASLQARLPGLAGRPLRAGDVIPIGTRVRGAGCASAAAVERPRHASRPVVLRFLPGPDADRFHEATLGRFESAIYRLSPASNRMGYRLQGPRVAPDDAVPLLSEAVPCGTIQVPPSGEPIVLMADRQTTGGYARIGTIISADLSAAGQLAPGDDVRFERCDRETALAALAVQERFLRLVGGEA